jgi:hypothetical protein
LAIQTPQRNGDEFKSCTKTSKQLLYCLSCYRYSSIIRHSVVRVVHFFFQLHVFTFSVPCCDARYGCFCVTSMFCSSLLKFVLEQALPTLPEPLSSPPVFSGVRVTRSLVLYVCIVDRCLSFCAFSFDTYHFIIYIVNDVMLELKLKFCYTTIN